MSEPRIDISVVVLSLNEGEMLQRTVSGLDATLPKAAEIIVVDDGSRDGSADFLNGSSRRTRLIRTENLGVARGRNYGARQARGRILVISDAHIDVPAGWWKPLVKILKDPKVGIVGPGLTDF